MKHQTPTLAKFKRLARRLGIRQYEAAGVLEMLWITTQTNCPRGDIGSLTNEDIAISLDWQGDDDELVTALVDCGWLDEHPEHRLVVHDWHDHAPRYIKGLVARKGGFVTEQCTSATYVDNVPPERTSATYVDNVREQQPNLTKPNLTKPKKHAAHVCTEPDKPASEPATSMVVVEKPLMTFDCVGKGPHTFAVTQSLVDDYLEDYPSLDVVSELRRAHAWIKADLTRRKTAGAAQE